MNDQTLYELDEIIRLNPTDAKAYINRGFASYKKGDFEQAIENYDSAVRFCANYETDFIDSRFAHGGKEAVGVGAKLLDNVIGSPCETAADFYYIGIQVLLWDNKYLARRYFEMAKKLGYDNQTKVERHLENLKNRK